MDVMRRIYYDLILYPFLSYGINVWGHSATYTKKKRSVKYTADLNRFLSTFCNPKNTNPIVSLYTRKNSATRLKVLPTIKIQVMVFCVVTPQSASVSENHVASIFRVNTTTWKKQFCT